MLSNIGSTCVRKSSTQLGRKLTGICKGASTSPPLRPISAATRASKHAWFGSPKPPRRSNDSMDALAKLLASPEILNEIIFAFRSGEILLEKRKQCRHLRNDVLGLRAQADKIQNDLIAAQERCDVEALRLADRDRQRVADLRAQAEPVRLRHNRLNEEENHGANVFVLAWDGIIKSTKQRLEQTGLLNTADEDAIQARLLATLPDNDIFTPEEGKGIAAPQVTAADDALKTSSAEQENKEALRAARLRASTIYEEAQTVLQSHREKYATQLNNHLRAISPGWLKWDASWTQAEFDVHYLELSMQHSTAVREAEEALFKAIDKAHSDGVSPMQPFQIYGYHDHPGDNSADSAGGAPAQELIDEWRNTLPTSPPLPEPWGPGVVQYPSDQMSDLERDVEAWETWSHRDEVVQRQRLLEKHRGPRPLGWTLPAEEGGANGGGGRLMNSHMI